MIKNYLLNYEQELIERKYDLSKLLQKNESALRENKEHISRIEELKDKSYESFSPINYTKDSNAEKLKELSENKNYFKENNERLKNEIDEITKRIEELNNIIRLVKENEIESKSLEKRIVIQENAYKELSESQERETNEIINNYKNQTISTLTNVINKIEFCTKLIDIDKNRCKLEMKNISSIITEIIEDTITLMDKREKSTNT